MRDYKKSETRQILEEIFSGKRPVRRADGSEYYVRYNDSKEELEEVPPPELRALTEEERAVAAGAAGSLRPQKTFGEYLAGNFADIGYGAKKALSGATFGGSDWLGRRLGVDMNDDTYLSLKDAEGLGNAARTAGFASEVGGNMLGAGGALVKGLGRAGLKGLKLASASGGLEGAVYGATGSDSLDELPENVAWGAALGTALPFGLHYGLKGVKYAARPVTEKATRYLGKRKLAEQLAKDSDFKDVNLGNIDDELATRLNQVRNTENVSPVESVRTSVTGERIGHIRDGRILRDKRSPDFMADVVDAALFSKQPHVIRGNIPENQVIFDSSNPANKVVVSKNSNTNGISVITAMKDKSLGKINKRLGGLPFPPYGANVTSDASTAAGSKIPDFQPLNKGILPQNMSEVNPAFKRSFVEALADENKRRIMRNAVMSGAEDLSERAKILSDRLERRNNGMYDADFEQVIKTPELSRAEEKYANFMAKNGGQMMPEGKVADFYAQHPIAEDMIAEMRQIDPRAFDSIQPGSLAEFDMLKKTLREEAGNKVKVGASRSGALKRAENDLKTLMDREFPGFRDVNRNFADAQTTQDIFESRLKKGLTSVGGATVSPFWSGISSPLTAAGVVGGYFNPVSLAVTAGGLGGKALMRRMRRDAGRRLADGIVQTPIEVNLNPALAAGLSSAAFNNLRNR